MRSQLLPNMAQLGWDELGCRERTGMQGKNTHQAENKPLQTPPSFLSPSQTEMLQKMGLLLITNKIPQLFLIKDLPLIAILVSFHTAVLSFFCRQAEECPVLHCWGSASGSGLVQDLQRLLSCRELIKVSVLFSSQAVSGGSLLGSLSHYLLITHTGSERGAHLVQLQTSKAQSPHLSQTAALPHSCWRTTAITRGKALDTCA